MNPYQGQYWRDVDPDSAMTKMERQYWITKQSVFQKIGKKDDECVVASDAELDAKLELFRSIQESCLDLQKIIDKYQEKICCLAQEENSMGRFLKEAGKNDKTHAGKMMTNVGKSLSYSGQQRLALRTPLLRLYQEVETFRDRAISDTLSTLRMMEKQRIEYRAALSWMKDISQELDPEKQLDKFRKVQAQVRRSKLRFDKSKLDCLQKIDLLAAARCNMFSHALVLYHNSLIQYCEKTSSTYHAISNSVKGYQHYDFCVIKELAEPSLKLAEELMHPKDKSQSSEAEKATDKDILLFFDSEYQDDEKDGKSTAEGLVETNKIFSTETPNACLEQLLALENFSLKNESEDMSSIKILEDVFAEREYEESLNKDWEEVFAEKASPSKAVNDLLSEDICELDLNSGKRVNCFPSTLLSITEKENSGRNESTDVASHSSSKLQDAALPNTLKNDKKSKNDMTTWFNLFADLDPLADPDALSRKSQSSDRNC